MSEPAGKLLVGETGATGPVLTYAQQEQRWEKGILWLVWIVWVTVILQVPKVAMADWSIIEALQRTRVPTSLGEKLMLIAYLGTQALINLGALALAVVGILVMTGSRRARPVMARLLWILAVGLGAGTFTEQLFEFSNWHFNPDGTVTAILQSIGTMVAAMFPLVLLALVLRRPEQPKRWAAAGIWWLTAAACMTAGLGLIAQWITQYHYVWLHLIHNLFVFDDAGTYYSPTPFLANQMHGIGLLAGTFAFASAYAVTLYTALCGPKGRPALLICAALLVVFAAGEYGGTFYGVAFRAYRDFRGLGSPMPASTILRDVFGLPLANALASLALWLAFPLAVRVALNLSSVRQLLDTRPPPP